MIRVPRRHHCHDPFSAPGYSSLTLSFSRFFSLVLSSFVPCLYLPFRSVCMSSMPTRLACSDPGSPERKAGACFRNARSGSRASLLLFRAPTRANTPAKRGWESRQCPDLNGLEGESSALALGLALRHARLSSCVPPPPPRAERVRLVSPIIVFCTSGLACCRMYALWPASNHPPRTRTNQHLLCLCCCRSATLGRLARLPFVRACVVAC